MKEGFDMEKFMKSDTLDVADKNVAKRREIIINEITDILGWINEGTIDVNGFKDERSNAEPEVICDETGMMAERTKRGLKFTLDNVEVELVFSFQENGAIKSSYFCTANKFMESLNLKSSLVQLVCKGEHLPDGIYRIDSSQMVDIMKLQPDNIYRAHKEVHIRTVPTGKTHTVHQLKRKFRKYFSDFEVRANRRAINRSIKFATM